MRVRPGLVGHVRPLLPRAVPGQADHGHGDVDPVAGLGEEEPGRGRVEGDAVSAPEAWAGVALPAAGLEVVEMDAQGGADLSPDGDPRVGLLHHHQSLGPAAFLGGLGRDSREEPVQEHVVAGIEGLVDVRLAELVHPDVLEKTTQLLFSGEL